ncbi:hypothetical protein RRG08_018936 [Elysia crispata]|uniref:MAM domain-containing protein n=1 Tax=Elysia crispata TaxID=231223 RepID=A0AAE1A4W8_9GAST|nr:hypothetical protein RRG08_018936 [Elysia crispata]
MEEPWPLAVFLLVAFTVACVAQDVYPHIPNVNLTLLCLTVGCMAQDLSCDFEQDFCAWTQPSSAKRDWSRRRGAAQTAGTGPSHDHTTGNGYYTYLETSLGFQGDDALLASPKLILTSRSCLSFYYHMYGPHVATLTVYSFTYVSAPIDNQSALVPVDVGMAFISQAHWTGSDFVSLVSSYSAPYRDPMDLEQ